MFISCKKTQIFIMFFFLYALTLLSSCSNKQQGEKDLSITINSNHSNIYTSSGSNTLYENEAQSYEKNVADSLTENADTDECFNSYQENQVLWNCIYSNDGQFTYKAIPNCSSIESSDTPEEDWNADDGFPDSSDPGLDIRVDMTFDTISDMQQAAIEIGMTVSTLGFSRPQDNGSAIYTISNIPANSVDNIFTIQLSNKLYANLFYDESSIINVACAGIEPEACIANQLNKLINSCKGKVSGIAFNSGTYYLEVPVLLESMNYYGNDTTLSVSPIFKTNGDKIILTKPLSENDRYTINLYGIDFLYETCSSHSLYDREIILVALQEIDSSIVENCTFTAIPSTNDGAYMKADLLWYKHSKKITNVNIRNCDFHNLTGKAYRGAVSDYLVGGCLWICGKAQSYSSEISNIRVSKCTFESTVSDEILAIWQGNIDDVEISDCSFQNEAHDSHEILSFARGEIHNALIKNSSFYIHTPCTRIFKLHEICNSSDVSYENCLFDINLLSDSNNCISVFYNSNDVESFDAPTLISINNCVIRGNKNSVYRYLFEEQSVNNALIKLQNSSINIPLKESLVYTAGTQNVVFNINNNDIKNAANIASLTESKDSTLIVANNAFNNCSIKTTINRFGNIDSTIYDNTFIDSKMGILININRVYQIEKRSSVSFYNNTINSVEKIYPFYSNTEITETEYGYIYIN